ncbi:MAG: dimethylsulfoxide reductase subunit B [Deltaproteobacteria bacterium]|jgi:anaerobic dimethyl sulfoxide reductase subunit B (iron-sulfur subunit)|nr:dimethylsulfoxide reductase subunit B [Deltaproteobacteria bacterium]
MKQPAFYLDMTACSGCKTCMVACIDGNDLPLGVMWRRVAEYTGGGWVKQPGSTYSQDVFSYYASISCNHCADPICVKNCPTTAMHKNAQGIVLVDHNKCVGCGYCRWSCPYSAPQLNKALGKMTKCDFCAKRLDAGLKPLCVQACPMRAIHFGEYEELKQRFGNAPHVAPLPEEALTGPCLVLTPPRNARPVGSRQGKISNPEEI